MSSFKRRVNPASGSSLTLLPIGVKPSSFSSPVPLISTGIPALDDLLSGGGLSSGSDLLIIPATGSAAQSAAQIGASSSTPATSVETDHATRAAAEPYVDLLLGYSIAQGIASGHSNVVIGQDADGLVRNLMARAGNLDEKLVAQLGPKTMPPHNPEDELTGPSHCLNTVTDEDDAENSELKATPEATEPTGTDAQREREMKIAWRYHNMKQFNTTVNEPNSSSSSEPTPFCQTFDLSKRIDSGIIQHATERGKLQTLDIAAAASGSHGVNSYEIAFEQIEAAVQRCRREATTSAVPPVLRIAIRALGSPAWTVNRGQTHHAEVIRFLHRLKRLLRSLSLIDSATSPSSPRTAAMPSMAVIGISSFLLSHQSSALNANPVNLPHRMVHSVDSAVSLSAFASSPALRNAFTAYTGAFKVLKTPAIGTLTNPSIRSSVLRGMGTGAGAGAGGGKGGGGEGGAGGGENNLAFKVRRKRLVIETLHLDVEGGVSERRTKPPKNTEEVEKKSTHVTKTAATTAESVAEQIAASSSRNASSFVCTRPASDANTTNAGVGAEGKPGFRNFSGLSSLRQRGLAAAAAASGQGSTPSQKEYSVEVETATHKHSHSNARPKRAAPANRVANTRAEDLEF
ncbi:uncharacterized protein MEPE_02832 [Melanopsichium pennsylvanicum]|uniref:Elongator complex protein 4 n=2 Tax=Melanopsichium pennsylvanicum TaxID=63383 RepID=A0AAJ4XKP1_9BASI|nr:paxneb-domain-containing protein [Melanopsichium pennsylvanicum 4]SNX84124.1 uncharacterized protein MEPE_02832 [Melanopsichium pennsylvanicum]